MTDELNAAELELSDAELIEVLKNHGIDRRLLMKALGAGAGIAALGGTAAGTPSRGARIDDTFGAPYGREDNVPSGIVDHVVELTHLAEGEDEFDGFPSENSEEEFVFLTVGLHVKPGDVVHFENLAHEHTVSAFHEKWAPIFPTRVPEKVPGFTSPPYIGGESWLYRFTEKGVYDVFCFPHLALGMVMRLVVYAPEEGGDVPAEYEDLGSGPDGLFANANRVLTDPALDPENIVENGPIAWEDLSLGDS